MDKKTFILTIRIQKIKDIKDLCQTSWSAQLRKNEATQRDPHNCWMFPPACTKSWLCAVNTTTCRHTTQVSTIQLWSYETFIVIETVIDRYLAVET